MNTETSEDSTLPKGWIVCSSKSTPGRKYYFHKKTGNSLWTKPQECEPPAEKRKIMRGKGKEQTLKKVIQESPKTVKRKNHGDSAHNSSTKIQSKEVHTPATQGKRPKLSPIKKLDKSLSSGISLNNDNTSTSSNKTLNSSAPLKKGETGITTDKSLISSTPLKSVDASTFSNISFTSYTSLISVHNSTTSNKSLTLSTSLKNVDTSTSNRSQTSNSSTKKNHKNSLRSIKKGSKPVLPKNAANARLSRLRAELSNEVKETEKSLPKESSITSQTDIKSGKVEKSPNINESKCNTQSPNDSLNSTQPPSQFFAANKIISSMKAHLPESHHNQQVKQKDTFADIEQGICNQTTEYPYMKHPATPPQFSEASKLVSAIKSKLSYKSVKETPTAIPEYKSANERLDNLRKSFSSEAMDVNVEHGDNYSTQYSNEQMEVDEKETKQNVPVIRNKKQIGSSKENLVLVVDTNIFIHELDLIKNVMNSHIKGYTEPPTLLVPWRVVNELDNLKDSNNGKGAICKRARPAMDYLYKSLPESDRIKVQPLRDANSHIYPCESPDDEILNCCLQQVENGKSVILLSNDKNLCTKAVANGVAKSSIRDLALKPSPQPAAKPHEQKRVQQCIYTLLSNILENEMRAKYNDLWLHVIIAPPPWSLADVLRCLLKHWIAVFNEVFPRIEHLLTELRDSLAAIEKKGAINITQYDLSNFKDLCLEVAKRCQIIPEYMELAKTTVAKLQEDSESDDGTDDGKNSDSVVIETFEGVWTVYSSYCAKLASMLGISHSIEDKLTGNDPIEVLTSKLDLFGNQITTLTQAIGGVLTQDQTESTEDQHLSSLENSFKDSLEAIGVNNAPINTSNLKWFSAKCRNMLQEAHSKFSQLVELLQICKNKLENNR